MEILFAYLILNPLGWLILFIKYRNLKKVKAIVKSEYENEYALVAGNYLLNIFVVIFMIMIVAVMVTAAISPFLDQN
ncbi:MAG: hypothetical protein PHQ74_04270 [Crocinitomicaceae bacterium]|nr:hypothetical protein [Crocinitomicaceae bacterium]